MGGMTQAVDQARGAALTLSEAAEACGVSRSTIRRRQAEFEHAYQDQTGSWRVPVSDLLGAGLKLRPRPVTALTQPVTAPSDRAQNGAEQARIDALTAELAAERVARQIAEARVTDLRANLEDLRFSLRAISGPPRAPEAVPIATPAPVVSEPEVPAPAPSQPVSGPRRAVVDPMQPAPAPRRRGRIRAWLRGA